MTHLQPESKWYQDNDPFISKNLLSKGSCEDDENLGRGPGDPRASQDHVPHNGQAELSIILLFYHHPVPSQPFLSAEQLHDLDEAIMNEPRPLTAPPPTPAREPITCHVLDLTTGRPASSVSVSLTLIRPFGPSAPLTAVTSSDGRVNQWNGEAGSNSSLNEIFANLAEHDGGTMVWSLKFNTGAYFGEDQTFFPEVEVRFFVDAKSGHYHVPLLLGPWSYTTYRGS